MRPFPVAFRTVAFLQIEVINGWVAMALIRKPSVALLRGAEGN